MSDGRSDIRSRLFTWKSGPESTWIASLTALVVLLGMFLVLTGPEWRDAVTERVSRGRKVGLEHEIRTISWYAALLNLLLLVGLILSRRWWLGDNGKLKCSPSPAHGKFFWIGLALIVVAGAAVRWPRMDLSLYNDEEYTFRRYVAGRYKNGEWEQVSWEKTAFFNKAGNNGMPFSLLARACYDASGAVEGEVREVPLRLPAFVAGVLSIAVIGLLAAQSGAPRAGLFGAALAALHPWHIRYSTEARAYGLVLLFAALALLAIFLGLQRKEWRWWILYALSQFGFLYAYPASLYLAVGLNVAAFAGLVLKDRARLPRLIVANLFTLMLLAQAMGPAVPQILQALGERGTLRGDIPASWWADIASYYCFGMQWFDHAPDSPINPAFVRWFDSYPLLAIAGLLAAGFLFVMGSMRLARSGVPGAVILAGSLASVPLAYLHCIVKGNILHFWYVIYALPFFLAAFAFGLPAGKSRRASFAVISLFAAWMVTIQFPLQILLKHPKEDLRGVILAMRGETHPFRESAGVATAGFWSEAGVYDPALVPLNTPEELEAWLVGANSAEAAYITFGRRLEALKTHAAIVARLEGSGEFEKVAVLPGIEDRNFTHFVFRWKGPKAQSAP